VIKSMSVSSSAPAGYRFPREVIAVAVRWYLRYGLSYRDVEELLAERGIDVDHVTVYRWVQTFTPVFIDAARPGRHATGNRWFVDETYVKVAGRWTLPVIARSISTGRSSTCWSRTAATRPLPKSSSPARCARDPRRSR
jgi:transposase-like protein